MERLDVNPVEIAEYLYRVKGTRCNCDLGNWSPTAVTGHSVVCRIHKAATAKPYDMAAGFLNEVRAARITKETGHE